MKDYMIREGSHEQYELRFTSSISLNCGQWSKNYILIQGTDFKQLFDLKDGATCWLNGYADFCMIGGLKLQK